MHRVEIKESLNLPFCRIVKTNQKHKCIKCGKVHKKGSALKTFITMIGTPERYYVCNDGKCEKMDQ